MLELFTDNLMDTVQDALSVPAVFRRGGAAGATKDVTVIPGSMTVEVTDGPDGFLRVPERQTQFKIEAAAIRPEFDDPRENDEFLIQLADRLQTWEILRPSSLAKAVVPSDFRQLWWRCFAKLVNETTTVAAPTAAELSTDTL